MRRVAWGLVALAIALLLGQTIVVWAAGGTTEEALRQLGGVGLVFSVCFPILGALVIGRSGNHAVGWLMSFIGVTIAIHSLAAAWSEVAFITVPGSLPAGDFASWVTVWLWIPGWFFATTLLPVLFPDGRLTRRRRLLARIDVAAIIVLVVVSAVVAWPLRGYSVTADVDQLDAAIAEKVDVLTGVYLVGVVVAAVLTILSFGSLVARFRRSGPLVRRQIAWVVYGASIAAALSIIGAFFDLGGAVQVLEALSLVGGIAIAMFRYDLYDIGVVVNRTLVYGGLTALLAGAYLLGVLALQWLLSPTSDLAIAGSTLAVAALFRPLRGRLQAFVDRRFYRRRYDAQRTLDAFSARLRNEVALEAMEAELRAVVVETVQPKSVFLWVRP